MFTCGICSKDMTDCSDRSSSRNKAVIDRTKACNATINKRRKETSSSTLFLPVTFENPLLVFFASKLSMPCCHKTTEAPVADRQVRRYVVILTKK